MPGFCHRGDGQMEVLLRRDIGAAVGTVVYPPFLASRSEMYLLVWLEPAKGSIHRV